MTNRDRDLDDEIAAHLRMAIADRVGRGESPEAAEYAARREFGNVTHVREVTRDQRRALWLERLMQDVRYGIRALRRTPEFTIAAVATLGVAIGANSAVFTVVRSVLLRPLPFSTPERLQVISYLPTNLPFVMQPSMVDRDWLPYRDRQHSFTAVTAYHESAMTLTGHGEALRLTGAMTDANFLTTLGRAPAVGRTFTADEEARDERVLLLSDRLWRERFATDSAVIGASVSLDGKSYRVIGIMPAGFTFPERSDFWAPMHVRLDSHNSMFLPVIGRLREGVGADQARAEVASILAMQAAGSKRPERSLVATILPLRDVLTGKVAKSLWILSGAVAFVLLVACANVANLLLIRATSRRHEMAVRVAIGAGRGRIASQLLTESALLGLGGGALGLVLATIGTRLLVAIAPPGRIPRIDEVHPDSWVFLLTLGTALVTGIAFGMVPAFQSARRPPHDALSGSARTVAGSHGRLRAALVTAEVALALVLLTGAGLMIKSFMRLRSADKGFDSSGVMTMSVDLPTVRYPDTTRMKSFHETLLRELARIPGVASVGAVSSRPLADVGMMGDFSAEASAKPRGFSVDKSLVSPGYFRAMGLRMTRGRDFAEGDGPSVILSESVAKALWPGEDPIGKRVSMETQPHPESWLTVVGVVSDVVHDRSMSRHPAMYFDYRRSSWTFVLNHMTYVVRGDAGARAAPAMLAALRTVDASVPAQAVMSMDDALLDVAAEPVFQTRLLTAFALIALLLAAIGTYGVLAYDVAQRSRELALMMALGATPTNVMGIIMRRTVVLAGTGALIGIAGSVGLTRVLKASLYDVQPTDAATMATVVVAILGVAALAGLAPARQAARVNVLTALSGD